MKEIQLKPRYIPTEEVEKDYISKDKIREIIDEEFIMYDAFYRIKKLVEE